MGGKKNGSPKKPSYDAKEVFLQGMSFEFSSRILASDNNNRLMQLHQQKIVKQVPSTHTSELPVELQAILSQHPDQVHPDMGISSTSDLSLVPTSIPSIINAVFAVELYLKCLLVIDNRPRPQKHELSMLFDNLLDDRKKSVEELYLETAKKSPGEYSLPPLAHGDYAIRHWLKDNENVFIEMRYVYELASCRGGNPFAPLNALRGVILRIKPDWVKLTACLCTRPIVLYPS